MRRIRPEWVVAAVLCLLLVATSTRYGWHRDEMYFVVAGRHPAWGYPDQPLLTPLLMAGLYHLGDGSIVVVRLASALAGAATAVLTGAIAGMLGGSARARAIAAAGWAVGAVSLVSGHIVTTTTFDVLATVGVCACLIRAMTTGRPRWMLVAGVVLGVGLLDKLLVGTVVALVVLAMLVFGPRRVLLSWWSLAGAVIAGVGALPYLLWQQAHGWPQSELARSIAGEGERVRSVPFQLLLVSVLLTPIWIAGLVRLLRPAAGPLRAFGYGYLALLVVLLITGGKGYYSAGLLPILMASGAVATDRWIARGRPRLRAALVAAAVAVSLLLNAAIGLAVVPADRLQSSGINDLNADAGEQVGWPTLVAAVRTAVRALPPAGQARAVIFAGNYGEASALTLASGLPPVYSGHNAYSLWPRPADSTGPVILVGYDAGGPITGYFTGCRVAVTVDNGLGLENEEQHRPVQVCDGPAGTWDAIWPHLVHYN